MISAAIVNALHGRHGLTKGKNLFAEQGQGKQCVVISATADLGDVELDFLHEGHIQVYVQGYRVSQGSLLAWDVTSDILAMLGAYANNGLAFEITGVSVRNWPALIQDPDGPAFSANLTIHFKTTRIP